MVSQREDKFKAKFCVEGDQGDIFLVLTLGAKMEVYHIITVQWKNPPESPDSPKLPDLSESAECPTTFGPNMTVLGL